MDEAVKLSLNTQARLVLAAFVAAAAIFSLAAGKYGGPAIEWIQHKRAQGQAAQIENLLPMETLPGLTATHIHYQRQGGQGRTTITYEVDCTLRSGAEEEAFWEQVIQQYCENGSGILIFDPGTRGARHHHRYYCGEELVLQIQPEDCRGAS